MRNSSSLAVTIAQAACPTSGNATAAAISIATAYKTNMGAAANAVAGVLSAGMSIVAVVQQVFRDASTTKQREGVDALAAAFAVMPAGQQSLLMADITAALNSVATELGCVQAAVVVDMMRSTGLQPQVAPVVCSPATTLYYQCPTLCSSPALQATPGSTGLLRGASRPARSSTNNGRRTANRKIEQWI